MDTITKNDKNVETSERLETFRLVFSNPSATTKDLKTMAIKSGFYYAPNEANLLKNGLKFLNGIESLQGKLPIVETERERSKESTFLPVWRAIVDNPNMDSNEIQELFPNMNSTTRRVAISWLGSVMEYVGTMVKEVETLRLSLKSLTERPTRSQTKVDLKDILQNIPLEELINVLNPDRFQEIVQSLSIEDLVQVMTPEQYKAIKSNKVKK